MQQTLDKRVVYERKVECPERVAGYSDIAMPETDSSTMRCVVRHILRGREFLQTDTFSCGNYKRLYGRFSFWPCAR